MNGSWQTIEKDLGQLFGTEIHFKNNNSVSGGDINDCFKLTDTTNKHWFIKTNKPSKLTMFEAEAAGLEELRKTNSFKVPESICHGKNKQYAYLVLEHIDLLPNILQKTTGQALAKMHLFQSTQNKTNKPFGWQQDNTIGSTPQSNHYHENWLTFWKQERLMPQLKLAKANGYSSTSYENGLKLAESLGAFFTTYSPRPSLLHGDLWSGNCSSNKEGKPVIFDPAVYWGDRETDIAMTELFGGFNQEFYDTYNAHYPLDQDYKTRKTLYNFYHILNHFNLFGGGYASQASSMTKHLLAQI